MRGETILSDEHFTTETTSCSLLSCCLQQISTAPTIHLIDPYLPESCSEVSLGASLALLYIFSAPSALRASGTVSETKGFKMPCDSGSGRTPHVADVFFWFAKFSVVSFA